MAPTDTTSPTDPRTAVEKRADVNLIMDAILASGMSSRRFAELMTWRDERTVRRWSAGVIPIPLTARTRLEWFLSISDARRRTLVEILTTSRTAERDDAA